MAPALEGYSAAVVRVKHGVGLYPVELTNVPKDATFKCETQDQFVAKLREVLIWPEVRGVLGSLLAQVRACRVGRREWARRTAIAGCIERVYARL